MPDYFYSWSPEEARNADTPALAARISSEASATARSMAKYPESEYLREEARAAFYVAELAEERYRELRAELRNAMGYPTDGELRQAALVDWVNRFQRP